MPRQSKTTPGCSEAARRLLNYLYRTMQIDDCWSVREDDRFTWWGYELAQRASIEPISEIEGTPIVSVRIETDCLRDVPDIEPTASLIDALNQRASLSAWVWDKERATVKLVCSLRCEETNLAALQPMLASAMAIQCADAHDAACRSAALLGCPLDRSQHPLSGMRTVPDDMLLVRELWFAPKEDRPPTLTKDEFARTAELLRRSFPAVRSDLGLTAEFPFWGSTTMLTQLAQGRRLVRRETSLLEVTCQHTHAVVGDGFYMLLSLPIEAEGWSGLELVRRLNSAEAQTWHRFSQLSAWVWDGRRNVPQLVSFFPLKTYSPGSLYWLVSQMYVRSSWAYEFVTEELGLKDAAPKFSIDSPASFLKMLGLDRPPQQNPPAQNASSASNAADPEGLGERTTARHKHPTRGGPRGRRN